MNDDQNSEQENQIQQPSDTDPSEINNTDTSDTSQQTSDNHKNALDRIQDAKQRLDDTRSKIDNARSFAEKLRGGGPQEISPTPEAGETGANAGATSTQPTSAGTAAGGQVAASPTGSTAATSTAGATATEGTGEVAGGTTAANTLGVAPVAQTGSGLTTGMAAAEKTGEVAATSAAATGGVATAETGEAAAGAFATESLAAGSGPGCIWVIIALAVIFLVAFMIYVMIALFRSNSLRSSESSSSSASQQLINNSNPVPGLNLQKSALSAVANGQNITYTISASYTQSGDITIHDQIPNQTSFVSATGKYNLSGNEITWNLKDNSSNGTSTGSYTFTLIVKPTANDINVTNTAWATETQQASSSNNAGIGNGNEPPNTNTCGGTYNLDNPLSQNFGDPNCALTTVSDRNKIYTLLKEQDPAHADIWFFNVIPCESSYNPDTYASQASIGTPDPAGAWGLFQMGRGRNGQYDHGDVAWEKQVSNAVNYNNNLIQNGAAWRYWQCASFLWGSKN